MRTSILALAAAAATLAGVAYAQQPPPAADPMGAATITRTDAQTRAAAMFDRFDANHDGKLDQADRAARMTAMFDQFDTNHDGAISRDEFTAAHERMGPGGRGMRRGGADHAGMDHGAMPPPPRGAEARAPLSRDAFVAEAMKRFDAADTNHDGKLTRDERRAAFRAHAGMGRHGRGKAGGHGMPGGPDMPPPPPPGG